MLGIADVVSGFGTPEGRLCAGESTEAKARKYVSRVRCRVLGGELGSILSDYSGSSTNPSIVHSIGA